MTLDNLIYLLTKIRYQKPELGEEQVTARMVDGCEIELRCTERDEDNDTENEDAYSEIEYLTNIEFENPPVSEGDSAWM